MRANLRVNSRIVLFFVVVSILLYSNFKLWNIVSENWIILCVRVFYKFCWASACIEASIMSLKPLILLCVITLVFETTIDP